MASSEETLDPLKDTLRDLLRWFAAAQTPFLIIGGVAASLLGRARLTRDVDALVLLPEESWTDFLESGKTFGFKARIADPVPFAFRSRVFLLQHTVSQIQVDISLGSLAFERDAIDRAVHRQIFGLDVPLPAVEDLIVMKAIAQRPQDLVDIDFLLEINPGVDVAYIRRCVAGLVEMMEAPEVYSKADEILTRHTQKARRRKKN